MVAGMTNEPKFEPCAAALEPLIETEREDDGRWIASVPTMPGMMAYGETERLAIANVVALANSISCR